jgi:hypothetical protein
VSVSPALCLARGLPRAARAVLRGRALLVGRGALLRGLPIPARVLAALSCPALASSAPGAVPTCGRAGCVCGRVCPSAQPALFGFA